MIAGLFATGEALLLLRGVSQVWSAAYIIDDVHKARHASSSKSWADGDNQNSESADKRTGGTGARERGLVRRDSWRRNAL